MIPQSVKSAPDPASSGTKYIGVEYRNACAHRDARTRQPLSVLLPVILLLLPATRKLQSSYCAARTSPLPFAHLVPARSYSSISAFALCNRRQSIKLATLQLLRYVERWLRLGGIRLFRLQTPQSSSGATSAPFSCAVCSSQLCVVCAGNSVADLCLLRIRFYLGKSRPDSPSPTVRSAITPSPAPSPEPRAAANRHCQFAQKSLAEGRKSVSWSGCVSSGDVAQRHRDGEVVGRDNPVVQLATGEDPGRITGLRKQQTRSNKAG